MSTEFEEFKEEVIAEIRANIHKYPSVCKMLLGKIDRLEAEADKAAHDLENAQLESDDLAAELARVNRLSTPPPRTYGQGAEDAAKALLSLLVRERTWRLEDECGGPEVSESVDRLMREATELIRALPTQPEGEGE